MVDLGAAPGGWRQVAAERVGAAEGRGRVVAVDILDMTAIPGVDFLKLDFLDDGAPELLPGSSAAGRCRALRHGRERDRAPQDRSLKIMALVEAAADFANDVLAPGGEFSARCCRAAPRGSMLALMKRDFASVKHVKPAASRTDSAELYLLATGYRGGTGR